MNQAEARQKFAALRAAGKRHRDAAIAMGMSEGEAISVHAGATDTKLRAKSLRGPWIEVLKAVGSCGPVLALTRNESTVHEKTGVYEKLSSNGHVGLALGKEIDLRLFLDKWYVGYAAEEDAANAGNPPSRSLQFFDKSGLAAHKIFERESTDSAAFTALIEQFAQEPQPVSFEPAPAKPAVKPDDEIDVTLLGNMWAEMKDTHEFFPLLRKAETERQQALRLMEGRFTKRAGLLAVRELLNEASFDGTPIMVFVGSPGCIQIHTGPVKRIEPMEIHGNAWLNVLDAGFNLHMREDLIASVWVVVKPTSDGDVTSVEAFDKDGELMAMFFGARKPGQSELVEWRNLVAKLPLMEVADAR